MENRIQNFTLLIASISRSIRRIKREETAGHGLSTPHATTLYYLHTVGPMLPGELSVFSGEDKANLSRALRQLEEGGYLTKAVRGRRRSELCLTELGHSVAAEIASRVDVVLSEASSGVSAAERDNLYRTLSEIDANLRRITAAYDEAEKTDAGCQATDGD